MNIEIFTRAVCLKKHKSVCLRVHHNLAEGCRQIPAVLTYLSWYGFINNKINVKRHDQ